MGLNFLSGLLEFLKDKESPEPTKPVHIYTGYLYHEGIGRIQFDFEVQPGAPADPVAAAAFTALTNALLEAGAEIDFLQMVDQ